MVKIRDNVKKILLGSNSSIFSSALLLSQAPPPSGLSGIYFCDESIESFAVIDLPQLLLVINCFGSVATNYTNICFF